MTDTRLHGYGRLPWDAARMLLDGCACTWTDLDGVQLTAVPPQEFPTGATHLWAWSDRWHVRLRFDTDAVYAAALSEAAQSSSEEGGEAERRPAAVFSEPVTPILRQAVLWQHEDALRAGPLPEAVHDQTWDLIEVPGAHPITFVRTHA